MKNIALAWLAATTMTGIASASAADLGSVAKAPLVASAGFSWTGCHIGTHAGEGSGHTRMRDPVANGNIDATMTGQTANTDMTGGLFGAQAGCDYQFNSGWVAGIEASASRSNITGTNQDQFNFQWTLRAQTDWLGGVTGRFGWAVERILLYGRGGLAFAHDKLEIENANINLGQPSLGRIGWTVGSGVEWAFAPAWSLFLEADHYGFGEKDARFQGNIPLAGNPPFAVRTRETVEAVKFGVNYRL
jgi:outer membrane immunogenic protein